jgi:tRNA modification GTPase
MARGASFASLLTDTIVAVASPPGEGGRAIVRLSGERSFPILRALSRGTRVRAKEAGDARSIEEPEPYTVVRGEVALPGWAVTLPVLLYLMPAPRSYTREDVAEIHLVGSPPVVLAALEACRELGARLAQAGEFTRRALLAGRITLSQAEAVLKVVDAQDEAAARSALQELTGSLGGRCAEVAEELFRLVTQVEAAIDFSQEGIELISAEELTKATAQVQAEIEALLSCARDVVVQAQPTVLLFGRPNVGKSSLFNRLLGRDAALVTAVPGTTRDAVEGILHLGDFRLRLLDGAGQGEAPRPSPDGQPLEARAAARTLELLTQADLTLHLIDGSEALQEEDRRLASLTTGRPHLWVLSKADLPRRLSVEALAEMTADEAVLHVSARSGQGLEGVREAIGAAFLGGAAQTAATRPPMGSGRAEPVEAREAGAGFLLNARQRQALERSASALLAAQRALAEGLGEEFVATDLWEALDALGEVTGQRTSDDVLDAVFSRFCIGK